MTGGQARAQPTRSPHRPTEERILDAIVEVVDDVGYAHLTVERIIAAAHLSRASFYQYFTSVDDAFWSAYHRHAAELCRDAAAALDARDDPGLAVLQALARFAAARPPAARLLMREGLAAGPSGLLERGELVAAIERLVSGAEAPQRIDVPPKLLIGGAFRFLAMRLTDGSALEGLDSELRQWADAFPTEPSRRHWSERLDPFADDRPEDMPTPSQRGGIRIEGSARERIVRGTALVIRAKGYHAITVADIVAAARVSRRGFYNEFSSKEAAFIATYEYGFQQSVAACSPAFLSANGWRERVWDGGLAFTSFVAREPLIASLGFIECYALGPSYTPRVHDTQLAFTLFLEDGYRQRPQAEGLSRSISDLAAATIFELAFQASRRGPAFDIRGCQPLAAYIALAPFIGKEEAGEFVIGKLSSRGDASAT